MTTENVIKRAELLIERAKLMNGQRGLADAINRDTFFPCPPGTPMPPHLEGLYAESRSLTEAIKAIDAALSLIDDAAE